MNIETFDAHIAAFLQQTVGMRAESMTWAVPLTIILGLILISYLFTLAFRYVFMPVVQRIVAKTKAKWDDYLFNKRVLRALQFLVPPIIWYIFLPAAFSNMPGVLSFSLKVCQIYLIINVLGLVSAVLHSVYEISGEHKQLRNRPLKGIYQMFNLVAIVIGVILIVSILIDKSVTAVMAGLGASAAVIMLIFKDSLLGLAAGVQLTANDMLRPGDWITMNKYGVNGVVVEVTLTTVKVRNFDRTIITVPPYLLVSDSFQNWRGMKDKGERRMKRSVNFDINTIHFCTQKDLRFYLDNGLISEEQFRKYSSRKTVNIQVFRDYILQYLRDLPEVNNDSWVMVRQLQSLPEGLPVEFYCFLTITDLEEFEAFQNDIMDYILAIIPAFGLRVFQSPTGADFRMAGLTKGQAG